MNKKEAKTSSNLAGIKKILINTQLLISVLDFSFVLVVLALYVCTQYL